MTQKHKTKKPSNKKNTPPGERSAFPVNKQELKKFAERIQALLRHFQMDLIELVPDTKISYDHLRRIMKAKGDFGYTKAIAIAAAFDMTLEQLRDKNYFPLLQNTKPKTEKTILHSQQPEETLQTPN